MTNRQNFEERMSKLSDEELYDVLAHESDYIPEAIEAAKKALQNRNLSAEKLTELESNLQEQELEKEEEADIPLSWPLRIFLFLFPLGVAQILISEYYRNKKYKKRAKECWVCMGYGIFFYITLSILGLL